MTNSFWRKPESIFTAVCLLLGLLGGVFIQSLVGQPKTLFGAPITAITPSAFPSILLVLLALLSAGHLFFSYKHHNESDPVEGIVGLKRGALFFGIMTLYALALVPLGFIISSAITLAALSWFVGNRVVWQIVLLTLTAPVMLYLAATRLLAVSLPEQNFIELAIARLLGA